MASTVQMLNAGDNGANTYENAIGVPEFDDYYSSISAKFSAHGSTLNGKFDRLAFNLAQPRFMIIGFMVTVILMGVLTIFALNDTWYNSPYFKMMIFITPLSMFITGWIFQYFSNMGKDNSFRDIINYAVTAKKEPISVNAV